MMSGMAEDPGRCRRRRRPGLLQRTIPDSKAFITERAGAARPLRGPRRTSEAASSSAHRGWPAERARGALLALWAEGAAAGYACGGAAGVGGGGARSTAGSGEAVCAGDRWRLPTYFGGAAPRGPSNA